MYSIVSISSYSYSSARVNPAVKHNYFQLHDVHIASQATCQEMWVFWWNINWNVRHDLPNMIMANYQSSTVDGVRVNHWLSLTQLLLKLYERILYLNITTDIHEHCTYRKYTVGRIRSVYRSVFVAIQLLWPVVQFWNGAGMCPRIMWITPLVAKELLPAP